MVDGTDASSVEFDELSFKLDETGEMEVDLRFQGWELSDMNVSIAGEEDTGDRLQIDRIARSRCGRDGSLRSIRAVLSSPRSSAE